MSDPAERIVRVVGQLSAIDPEIALPLIRALLPGLWPDDSPIDLMDEPPWDHDAIQAWFLRSVRSQPHEVLVPHRGGSRYFHPGWSFGAGSTDYYSRTYHPNGNLRAVPLIHSGYRDIAILKRGRKRRRNQLGRPTDLGFNATALRAMAKLAQLPPLPGAPSFTRRGSLDATSLDTFSS